MRRSLSALPCVVLAAACAGGGAYDASTGGQMLIARLGNGDTGGLERLAATFARRNPGYALDWRPRLGSLGAGSRTRIVFVQDGKAEAKVRGPARNADSEVDVGDIIVLRADDALAATPAFGGLVFEVPHDAPDDLPAFVRPDWDPKITDTPGGCATETGAYRRILLTWLRENGPYNFHALNAHRVRIMDSFSHYHPIEHGFDEFYLVQMAQPGTRLITSERVPLIETPERVTRGDVPGLLQQTPLQVGDLVYLPRGLLHRGVGGVLAQVITVPGFVPGSEIGCDHHLRAINERLELGGQDALPYNVPASAGPVVK